MDGNAVDEFVVEIGGQHLIELLRNEIHEVDGAAVLDIRSADSYDARRADDVGAHVRAVHQMGHPLDRGARAARRG